MNLQHVKILLKKINTLNDSLSLDNGPIASIERDLMLSYIRQLYEAYLDVPSNGTTALPVQKVTTAGPERTSELEIIPPPAPEEAAPEPPKRKYTPPKIIDIPDAKPSANRSAGTSPTTTVKRSRTTDPKLKELFDLREAKELSEKLGLQPIKDLTKALSINDRLLYTNDLYAKDTNAFNAALQDLNNASDMDKAIELLENQAGRYNWQESERADTARDFIKLVRRRHI